MVQPENLKSFDLELDDQSTGSSSQKSAFGETESSFVPQVTADGTYTFFSPEFQEAFHSNQGAKLEAELKFVQTTKLTELAQQPTICILDVCYGLGYNTAAALEAIWQVNPECHVQWFGLELDLTVPRTAIAHNLLFPWSEPVVQLLDRLANPPYGHAGVCSSVGDRPIPFTGELLLGDARQTIQRVYHSGFQADAIFLDPFSPMSCPQLWTVEFLGWVVRCLAPTGRLTTYSCSAAARNALRIAGLTLGSTPGVGRKSPGTVASFTGHHLPMLSKKEEEHLRTRSSIPYRDPTLSDSMGVIIQRRRQEQAASALETTSQWKKRWLRQDALSVGSE